MLKSESLELDALPKQKAITFGLGWKTSVYHYFIIEEMFCMDVVITFLLIILVLAVILMIPTWLENIGGAVGSEVSRRRNEKRREKESIQRNLEREKKMNGITNSAVFKNLEQRIFISAEQYPLRIQLDSWGGKSVKIFRVSESKVDVTIDDNEIPDAIDFMRALAYKYGEKYTYEEHSTTHSDPGTYGYYYDKRYIDWIELRLRLPGKVKVSEW